MKKSLLTRLAKNGNPSFSPRHLIVAFIALVALGFLFVGCSNPAGSSDPGSSEPTRIGWPEGYLGTWVNGSKEVRLGNSYWGDGVLQVIGGGEYGIDSKPNNDNPNNYILRRTGATKFLHEIRLDNEGSILHISYGVRIGDVIIEQDSTIPTGDFTKKQ
jgi:hypothetical protein